MLWTKSNTLALAKQGCTFCFGLGLLRTKGKDSPCKCVLRSIFRACHRRFRKCATAYPRLTRVDLDAHRLERHGGRGRLKGNCSTAAQGRSTQRIHYGFPNEEYCTDFLNVAKRVLGGHSHGGQPDTPLYQIFKWHFLHGADFRLVNRQLGRAIDDRNLFHDFYRIEEQLGRAFAETEPYALWPLDEYFGGTTREKAVSKEAVSRQASAIGSALKAAS